MRFEAVPPPVQVLELAPQPAETSVLLQAWVSVLVSLLVVPQVQFVVLPVVVGPAVTLPVVQPDEAPQTGQEQVAVLPLPLPLQLQLVPLPEAVPAAQRSCDEPQRPLTGPGGLVLLHGMLLPPLGPLQFQLLVTVPPEVVLVAGCGDAAPDVQVSVVVPHAPALLVALVVVQPGLGEPPLGLLQTQV